MGRIDDIMCDDITCKGLNLASVAGMDDITCDEITYEFLHLSSLAGTDDIILDDLACDDIIAECMSIGSV